MKSKAGLNKLQLMNHEWTFLSDLQPIYSYRYQKNFSDSLSSKKGISYCSTSEYLSSQETNINNIISTQEQSQRDIQVKDNKVEQMVNDILNQVSRKEREEQKMRRLARNHIKKELEKQNNILRCNLEFEADRIRSKSTSVKQQYQFDQEKYHQVYKLKDLIPENRAEVLDQYKNPLKYLPESNFPVTSIYNSKITNLKKQNYQSMPPLEKNVYPLKMAQSVNYELKYLMNWIPHKIKKPIQNSDILMDLYENSFDETQRSYLNSTQLSSATVNRYVNIVQTKLAEIKRPDSKKKQNDEPFKILKPSLGQLNNEHKKKMTKDRLRSQYDGWYLPQNLKMKKFKKQKRLEEELNKYLSARHELKVFQDGTEETINQLVI